MAESDSKTVALFLRDKLLSGVSASELFVLMERDRVDVSRALAILKEPSLCLSADAAEELEDLVTFDVAYELVEHFGAQRAAAMTARIRVWEYVDVVQHHAEVREYLGVRTAIARRDPIDQVYAQLRAANLSDEAPAWLLYEMVQAYPLNELVALAPQIVDAHARIIGERLRRRCPPLAVFDQLVNVVKDEHLVLALARYWNVVPLHRHAESGAGALGLFAQLHVAELRPIASLIACASERGDVAWWLPILRAYHLKAAQAALHLLEQGSCVPDVAQSLARAGYDDDAVLVALLENGIGTQRSLELLRHNGWNAAQMTSALHQQDALLPEVRSHLEDLGIPPSLQRTLALKHWDASIVDVVFGSAKALPPGHE